MKYSYVNPGDTFKPSAEIANAVRRLLNREEKTGGGIVRSPGASDVICQVYNSGTGTISAGQVVGFSSGTSAGDIQPCGPFSGTTSFYGIALNGMATTGDISDCLLSGLATVAVRGGTGNFVRPVEGTMPSGASYWEYTTAGCAIVRTIDSGNVVAAIGMGERGTYGGGGNAQYAGPFAVTLNGSTAVIAGGHAVRANTEDSVSGGSVTVSGSTCGIYLVARYNTTSAAIAYSFISAASASAITCPSGYTQYVAKLARIAGSTVTQSQYGDVIVTGVWL